MIPNAMQREVLAYVVMTNVGATKHDLIEDFAPVGAHLWVDLCQREWVEERGDARHIFLTEAGERAMALHDEGT